MTPDTDVVIGVRGTRRYPIERDFLTCVETLRRHTSNVRLLVVDDASDSEGRKVIEQVTDSLPNCLLIRTHKQRWFTRAYNLGLRLARTPRVVLLNADTILDEGWLEELYAVWAEFEQASGRRCGLVGSVLSEEEPRRWMESAGKDYVTMHAVLASMEALSQMSAARGQPGIYLDETQAINVHIRSDVTCSWDMNSLGWATVKSFKSKVGHVGGRSWGYRLDIVQNLRLEDVAEQWV